MRKVKVGVERRAAPNTPRLNAAMVRRCNLNEIRHTALLERQRDIPLQRRLVALGREVIMRLPLHNIAGQRALGQQRIARDVAPGDVTTRQQRDRHADFVGLLLLVRTRYGQGAHFFGRDRSSRHGPPRS